MSNIFIGGIEGGATNSHAVIMNTSGEIVGKSQGLGTNHYLLGMKECRKRIAELIDTAKEAAGISKSSPLSGLGLSLSGCEEEESNQELVQGLHETYPHLAEKITVGSDTVGSVAATSNKGGVVCIAGTGSNTLLINPDGKMIQCGGWGYILGDEGSAYKISFQAIKYCFNELDNFSKSPHPIEKVWTLVKEHFKIKGQADILNKFYTNFDKAYISSLCKNLAALAKEEDKLAEVIFQEAGSDLARSICAVASKAANELVSRDGGLHVLCVGSVWLSWDLLEKGFVTYIRQRSSLKKLSLMRLTTDMGVGAAYMASDRLDLPLSKDHSKNYDIFFRYSQDCKNKNACS